MTVGRDVKIEVRVSAEEKAEAERLAAAQGLSVSEFARRAFFQRVERDARNPSVRAFAEYDDKMAEESQREKVVVSEPPSAFRCPRGCDPGFRPSSSRARCPHCRASVVPA